MQPRQPSSRGAPEAAPLTHDVACSEAPSHQHRTEPLSGGGVFNLWWALTFGGTHIIAACALAVRATSFTQRRNISRRTPLSVNTHVRPRHTLLRTSFRTLRTIDLLLRTECAALRPSAGVPSLETGSCRSPNHLYAPPKHLITSGRLLLCCNEEESDSQIVTRRRRTLTKPARPRSFSRSLGVARVCACAWKIKAVCPWQAAGRRPQQPPPRGPPAAAGVITPLRALRSGRGRPWASGCRRTPCASAPPPPPSASATPWASRRRASPSSPPPRPACSSARRCQAASHPAAA